MSIPEDDRPVDLFGNTRKRRRHDGPTAIVHVPADRCPDCGETAREQTRDQGALIRHGGYGATERTVTRSCPCGWSMVAETSEVKPAALSRPEPDGGNR